MTGSRAQTCGFSLVEVTLALGVAAISLTAVFALLPIGLQTNYSATEQTAASDILAAVIADLRATPPTSPPGNSATSAQFGITVPGGSGGSASASTLYFDNQHGLSPSANGSRYRLTVQFPSNGGGSRTATFVYLKMTWPALADPTNAVGSAETLVALDRN